MLKPWSGLAAMMLLLSMWLYVTAMVSSHWLENQSSPTQSNFGPYEACVKNTKESINECRHVDDSCSDRFAYTSGNTMITNCDELRTTRAFEILGVIFAGIAFVMTWLAYHAYDDIMYRMMAIVWSLVSFTCGLIGWAVFTAMAQRDYPSTDWNYGWGEGLALGAWLLPLAAAITCMVPSPLRDVKTGEVIARDTIHGRRGSFADIFTRRFWLEGGGWGGREPVGTGAPGSSPRGGYEVGRGVGYRESYGAPTKESYRYGETGGPAARSPERHEYERRHGTIGGGLFQVGSKDTRREDDPVARREHERGREYERGREHERGYAGYPGESTTERYEAERARGAGMFQAGKEALFGRKEEPMTSSTHTGYTSSHTGYGAGAPHTSGYGTVGSTTTSTAPSREPSPAIAHESTTVV